MISEQLFMWLISGMMMVIGFMMVWIIKNIVSDQREQKSEIIVLRDHHHNLRIDHEILSSDVQALVKIVESNEKRDNRRLEIMEKMLDEIKKK